MKMIRDDLSYIVFFILFFIVGIIILTNLYEPFNESLIINTGGLTFRYILFILTICLCIYSLRKFGSVYFYIRSGSFYQFFIRMIKQEVKVIVISSIFLFLPLFLFNGFLPFQNLFLSLLLQINFIIASILIMSFIHLIDSFIKCPSKSATIFFCVFAIIDIMLENGNLITNPLALNHFLFYPLYMNMISYIFLGITLLTFSFFLNMLSIRFMVKGDYLLKKYETLH